MSDPYRLVSGALRNRLGIGDPVVLRAREADFSQRRVVQLQAQPGGLIGPADLGHFKRIHGFIFQDVYEWAGRTRDELVFPGQQYGVNIAKGGSSFVLASVIEDVAAAVSASLAKENFLKGLPREQFAERLSEYYGKWNALHPFREGNGRTTRAVMSGIARQSGYVLDYSKLQLKADGWNAASKLSISGDLTGVKAILGQAIRKPEGYVFEHAKNLSAALKSFPHLISAVEALSRIMTEPKIASLDPAIQHNVQARLRKQMSTQIDTGKFGFSRQALNPLTLKRLIDNHTKQSLPSATRGPKL